jgi:hypothetical protein
MSPDPDIDLPEPAPTVYELPLADLAKAPAVMPDEAAQKLAEAAERRAMEEHPAVRLRVLERTCRELKAGTPFDVWRHAEAIRPWDSLYRAVTEIDGIDQAELFATAAAWLSRQLAGKSRQTDRIMTRPPAPSTARKAASRPASSTPDYGDVI